MKNTKIVKPINNFFKDPKIEKIFNDYLEDNDRTEIKATLNNNKNLTNEQVHELAHNGFDPNLGPDCHKMILDIIKNNYDLKNINPDLVKKMSANKYFVNVFKYFIKKKIILPEDCLVICIMNNNANLLEFLVNQNLPQIKLIQKNLELACKYSNAITIGHILQHKIKTSKKCFDILLKRFKIRNLQYIKDDFTQAIELTDIPELKIFCDYGYVITQDDLVDMIKNGIYVKNYKKYDLEIDDDLKDACNECLCFPYPETKLTKMGFACMFKSGIPFDIIKKIEKKYKMKPDFECLKMLCKGKNPDYKTLLYLSDDNDIMPNEECLKSIIRYGNERCIKHIYYKIYGDNYYDPYADDAMEEYDNNEYRTYEKYLRNKCRQYQKHAPKYEEKISKVESDSDSDNKSVSDSDSDYNNHSLNKKKCSKKNINNGDCYSDSSYFSS
jgi:hypothetical protein